MYSLAVVNKSLSERYIRSYSYGINGQLKDEEIYGNGNLYSAEYWQYDPRLGRRWNLDPVVKDWESPYACFANDPIWITDIKGSDTAFSDNGARKLFKGTYNAISKKISSLQSKKQELQNKIKDREEQGKGTKRLERKLLNVSQDVDNWASLKAVFDDIISSKVLVTYGLDGQGQGAQLAANEAGYTSVTGENQISIIIKDPNDGGNMVHESTHGWQHIVGEMIGDKTFGIELQAFKMEAIYDYGEVQSSLEIYFRSKGNTEIIIVDDKTLKQYIEENYKKLHGYTNGYPNLLQPGKSPASPIFSGPDDKVSKQSNGA